MIPTTSQEADPSAAPQTGYVTSPPAQSPLICCPSPFAAALSCSSPTSRLKQATLLLGQIASHGSQAPKTADQEQGRRLCERRTSSQSATVPNSSFARHCTKRNQTAQSPRLLVLLTYCRASGNSHSLGLREATEACTPSTCKTANLCCPWLQFPSSP